MSTLPESYCAACSSVLYESDTHCFHCGAARPDSGWPELALAGDPWLGRVLAERYLVTRKLARSARAMVYVADSRIIPRSFAVKIMSVRGGPRLDEQGLRQRLRREIEAIGTLRNPHLVGYYDVFDLGDEHVALVMDLLEGVPLDALLESGPLPLPRALELGRQIANGLYEAHQRGLIHRDLKPSNVIVEKLPVGDDFVRILDFGVMWIRGTAGNTGAFDDFPVYASPEQIAGEELDTRSDLYSLGALLFLLLTGEPPFDPADFSQLGGSAAQLAPTLEDVTGREFPARVEALVAKLLEREPARRPSDIMRVLEWLDEIDVHGAAQERLPQASPSPDESSAAESRDVLPADDPRTTAMGMVPTVAEPRTPVLRLDPSEASAVSEASVDEAELPALMACRREGYAFLRGAEVVWQGALETNAPAQVPPEFDYISFAMCRTLAVLGTRDGRVVIARPGETARSAFQDPRLVPMTAVAVIDDGSSIIAGSESGRLYISRGEDFVRMGGGDQPITALCLSTRGEQFAIARGQNIQVLSTGASNLSTFPTPLSMEVRAMAFSPDAYLIAILTTDGTVVLQSVHTGQEFMRVQTGDERLRSVTFSEDNHLMGLFLEGTSVVLRTLT